MLYASKGREECVGILFRKNIRVPLEMAKQPKMRMKETICRMVFLATGCDG